MPNTNRDRGIRAELEACKDLTKLLDTRVVRKASEGIREDLGDLYGIPDVCFQVTAIGWKDTGAIAQRARTKARDCAIQQARRNTRHGVVLLRLDGQSNRPATWRAIITEPQYRALYVPDSVEPIGTYSQGVIIRDHADIWGGWMWAPGPLNLWVTTIRGWVASYQRATRWADA